jgi:hypothetical protein
MVIDEDDRWQRTWSELSDVVPAVPNKNAQHRHSKPMSVKWSFSRRQGGHVSHTRLWRCADGANAARENTSAPT